MNAVDALHEVERTEHLVQTFDDKGEKDLDYGPVRIWEEVS